MLRQLVSPSGMRLAMRATPMSRAVARRQAVSQRRAASTASPVEAVKATAEAVKSDAPWAITSLLVFGSLFVYVTSPSSDGKHKASHHSHGPGLSITSTEASDDDDDAASTGLTDESAYDNVSKINEKPGEDAPSGDRHLARNSLTAEEGALKQKPTKTAADLYKADDTTFKAGIASAKEGHSDPSDREKVISDPKKVVAAAQATRQDKKAKAAGEQPEEEE